MRGEPSLNLINFTVLLHGNVIVNFNSKDWTKGFAQADPLSLSYIPVLFSDLILRWSLIKVGVKFAILLSEPLY